MLDRARVWFIGTALMVPPLWFAWKMLWSAPFEGMTSPWAGRVGFRCFGLTLAYALGPLILLALARPTRPTTTSSARDAAPGVR